jgi:hypothetical protein
MHEKGTDLFSVLPRATSAPKFNAPVQAGFYFVNESIPSCQLTALDRAENNPFLLVGNSLLQKVPVSQPPLLIRCPQTQIEGVIVEPCELSG